MKVRNVFWLQRSSLRGSIIFIFVNNLYQLYTNLCNHLYISRLQLVVVVTVTLTCHNYATIRLSGGRLVALFEGLY